MLCKPPAAPNNLPKVLNIPAGAPDNLAGVLNSPTGVLHKPAGVPRTHPSSADFISLKINLDSL
jgi:hypothetical protein